MVNTDTFEWVGLPSKGQCYPKTSPLRKGKVAVAYLTAMDENIMVSEKLIELGNVCLKLLEKKIVDKDIDVSELCSGDKEAIVLWLRKTGYGNMYKKPNSEITIDLDEVRYKDFYCVTDNNGNFTYYTANGDTVTYRLLPFRQEEELIANTIEKVQNMENEDGSLEDVYMSITISVLLEIIVSINGKTDKEYIYQWLSESDYDSLRKFQRYITYNSPGLDMETTQGISFDDTIFYGIRITN